MINKKIITTLAILLFNLSAINVAYAAAKIGELNFGNKAKYIGEVKNGKAHGIGALKTVDGNNYIGNFSRNIINGEGILIKLHADGKLADLKINDNFPQLNKSQIQGALTDFRDRWVNLKQVEDQITYNTDQDEGFFTKLKVQRQNLKKEFFESTYPEWWKGVLKKSNNNEKILLDEIQIFVGKWRYGTHNEYLGKNKNFRRQIKLKKLDQIAEDEKKEDEDEIGDVIEDNIEDKEYIDLLKMNLNQLNQENFDYAFYVAGVDIHFNDRLGKLKISDEGVKKRDELVTENFFSKDIPLCGVLGGGYNRDFNKLVELHSFLHQSCAKLI